MAGSDAGSADAAWARQVRAGTAGNFDALNAGLVDTSYDRHLRFLNYGYEPLEGEEAPGPRLPVALPNKDSARLVFAVADGVDLRGRRLLDVGCGRGGAVWLLTRYGEPGLAVGADLAGSSVAFAAAGNDPARTAFVRATAEALPFPDRAFDVVFNLESSACYPSMEAFYREVARLLEPGGSFLYADLIPNDVAEACRSALDACGLRLEAERDITPNVLASRRHRAERQKVAIGGPAAPAGLGEWVGEAGSSLFDRLAEDRVRYLALRLTRTRADPPAGPLFDEASAAALRATAAEAVTLLGGDPTPPPG